MTQGAVHHVPVAGAQGCQDELAQVLALAHLGIVLHPHVESVQLVPGDVSQELGQVQAPEELHGRIEVAPPMNGQPRRTVVKVGVSEHVAPGQGLFVRLQVDGVLEELPEVPGGAGAAEVGGGEDGVAGGWGLARGAAGRARPVGCRTGPSAALLLRVLPVHGVPAGQVVAQAFLGLGGRPALLGLLHRLAGGPPAVLLRPRLLLLLVLHPLHRVPVGVLLQVALAAAAGAEAEGQVVALLGPHVLAALLLVPAAGAADAVELDQDAALPLVEALQVHPGAVRALLVVAHHPLVVVLLQVHRPPEAADQGRRTRGFWGEAERERFSRRAVRFQPAPR